MRKVIEAQFFNRPVVTVAEDLLGKFLVCALHGAPKAYMITETEAYDGEHDLACHASKGRTTRTEVMYGPAGHWYVYLVYGMYDMLNIVCGAPDYPAAVLIRGAGPYNGPGKLTKALAISRTLNTQPASKSSGLWIEDRGIFVPKKDIERTPRIGVSYAKDWADKPYRFVLKRPHLLGLQDH